MRRQLTLEETREFSEFIKNYRVDFFDLGHWLIKEKEQDLNNWMNT